MDETISPPGVWGERFKEQLDAVRRARRETLKDFRVYKEKVMELFASIERLIAQVDSIDVSKPVVTRTGEFRDHLHGPVDTVKSLCLKCDGHPLDFVPEGINYAASKGRLRIRHTCKRLSRFLYASLVPDPDSTQPYPTNLIWVLHEESAPEDHQSLQVLDEERMKEILEKVFLEV